MSLKTRRGFLAGAVTGVLLAPRLVSAADLVATPAQTLGPFYPREFPLDRDADLVTVSGAQSRAQGTIAHVFGRVRDVQGRAVPGARVEIWQCNAFGRYHHAGDSRNVPLDPGFQGYGETVSATDGAYRFRTIRPIAYPGRTPHIHFAVTVPQGGKLVTQMYVEGEPGNERDGLLRNIRDPEARKSVIVPLQANGDELNGRFDIVLGLNVTRT